jgi:hypothetical protein
MKQRKLSKRERARQESLRARSGQGTRRVRKRSSRGESVESAPRRRAPTRKCRKRAARPVLDTLSGLRSGQINPKSLSQADRLQCVEHLGLIGRSVPEIAKIVGKSDRTIRRYRAKIRARNALAPSPTFTRELVGDTVQRAYQSHSHLVQIAHDKSVSPRDRAFAAREAWKTWRDLIPPSQGAGLPVN